jgi:hypothetical protein
MAGVSSYAQSQLWDCHVACGRWRGFRAGATGKNFPRGQERSPLFEVAIHGLVLSLVETEGPWVEPLHPASV